MFDTSAFYDSYNRYCENMELILEDGKKHLKSI